MADKINKLMGNLVLRSPMVLRHRTVNRYTNDSGNNQKHLVTKSKRGWPKNAVENEKSGTELVERDEVVERNEVVERDEVAERELFNESEWLGAFEGETLDDEKSRVVLYNW